MRDIITVGELLIDLTQTHIDGNAERGHRIFKQGDLT